MTKENIKLIDWLYINDEYELLWFEESPIQTLKNAKYIIEELNKILNETASKIGKLSKKKQAKGLGIGDTDTDESIVQALYKMIH